MGLLQQARGRAVAPVDLHLTLCFLGAVDDSAIPALQMFASRLEVAEFSLQFDRIEYWREPRVLVAVAAQAPAQGCKLVQALALGVSELGFAADPKPWRPHVTLARGVSPRRVLPGPQSGLQMAAKLKWPVDCFHLVESRKARNEDLIGPPPRYALLGSWPLHS